jgi:hypothetical protein
MKFSPLCILALALLVTLSARAQQNPDLMAITVRSGVDSAEKDKRDHDPAYAQDTNRARHFFLAHVQEEKGRRDLKKPVDAKALAELVTRQLEAQGFHAVQANQKPEIVITVKYGRGFLPNPYTDSDADKQRTNLSNSDSLEIWPTHDSYVGLEEKRQLARHEKLIIQVRAWKYPPPPDPKQKEELMWMTTVYVSDPNHVDLNEVAPKMLTIAAPYFDRHIAREHEVVKVIPRHEHVNVGAPEVVGPPAPTSK